MAAAMRITSPAPPSHLSCTDCLAAFPHENLSLKFELRAPAWHGNCRTPQAFKVVSRFGGGRGGMGRGGGFRPRPPRPGMPQRNVEREAEDDGVLMNERIRAPMVRLVDGENMIGVVPTSEALSKAINKDLDLVLIAADADPPVAKIMDYSKYRYEQQKRKREQQKKAAASRVEIKELKMRYNIDTHDYDVRLRAAQRFLKDGDKVKLIIQFKGREVQFKDLALKLFKQFENDIGELGVIESKVAEEGRAMSLVFGPNKAALQKATTADKLKASKSEDIKEADVPDVEEPLLVS